MRVFLALLFGGLSFVCRSQGGPQRMVLLPAQLASEYTKWLCIDYFKEGPGDNTYTHVLYQQGQDVAHNPKIGTEVPVKNGSIIRGGNQYPVGNSGPVIVGTSNEPVPNHYARFIEELFSWRPKRELTDIESYEVQDSIWAYNILMLWKFLEPTGPRKPALTQALHRFGEKVLGNTKATLDDLLELAGKVSEISQYDFDNPTLIHRNKMNGNYSVFEGNSLIYSGADEKVIAGMVASQKRDQTITTILDGFSTADQEEALLFTLGNFMPRSRFIAASYIYISDLAQILESEWRLEKPITLQADGVHGGYFYKKFSVEDEYDVVKMEAAATSRNVLFQFIQKLNRAKNSFTFKAFCNSFLNDMMQKGLMTTYSQFRIRIIDPLMRIRITKVKGAKNHLIFYGGS